MASTDPLLVVGLGNPGPKYRDTRHNIGFLVVEELARRLGWAFAPGDGRWREASAPGGDGALVLMQPLTYMNLSGEAVCGWGTARGMPVEPQPTLPAPEEVTADECDSDSVPAPAPERWRPLVICDDLALPLGALRLRPRGSSGGQNGLASIIEHLGHDDFPRLRLGIAPAGEPVPPADWADFVLTPFAAAEREAVADLVSRAADAVACCRELGAEAAASRFNRR
jgi:PTH1 family peptidyl-tRNA hydrolase